MCGISGFVNPKIEPKQNIQRMMGQMIHRGPDAEGIWIDPLDTGVVLGHRRLSIIDLSENGAQPMVSHSRRFVISYNGEIYNHSYLLEQMRIDGYNDSMNGTSDTEILVEAIAFYGLKKTLNICKGMFAFALYDREEETLTLVRDRIGEKPLYYGIVNEGFAFCSELASIRSLDGFNNPINKEVLGIYLTYGYIPAPYSIYKNVWKLEPGTMMKIKCRINKCKNGLDSFEPKVETYWSAKTVALNGQNNLFKGTKEEAANELERLLLASIKDQMIADVPLGAFLSAGIDSTTVVSLMQSVSDKPVKTFTIGFENQEYNEAIAAKDIARYLNTDHTELYVTKRDAIDVIPLLTGIYDEPFADSSQVPTYLVSKLAREKVTVSLSGDGGDELFGGYSRYMNVERIWNKISSIPHAARTMMGAMMRLAPLPGEKGYALRNRGNLMASRNPADMYRREFMPDSLVRDLSGECKALPYKYNQMKDDLFNDAIHTQMLMDLEMYHVDDILVKIDRSAMAVSLESRVPMLDKDIVEFAWTLPVDYLRSGNAGKLVLKDVLYKYVPKSMMDRPKTGFAMPIKEWLREGELREWAEELLNPELIKRQDVLPYKLVENCWKDYVNKGIWRQQIWFLLMLQNWMSTEDIKNCH